MKLYIDITPILITSYGSHYRLGTVRYTIDGKQAELQLDQQFGGKYNTYQATHERIYSMGPDQLEMHYEVCVSSADVPQPETLVSQGNPNGH